MGAKIRSGKKYKDASYLTFGSGGGGSTKSSRLIMGIGGNGGSGSIQIALRKEKERQKEELKNQVKEYKRQMEIKEEIRKQEAKINEEKKQAQMQQYMVSPKVLDTHTRDISSPKLKNIFKEVDDSKHRSFLFEQILREERDHPKEDNFIIKIIKNIGKKKPPKNMTIVQ